MLPPARRTLSGNRQQQGFSIVELMVAVTLGLVLLAGLIQMFISSKQGYRIQESGGRLQENSRFAMEYLANSIRQTGFFGGQLGTSIDKLTGSPLANPSAAPCSIEWMTAYQRPIEGWKGADTSPLAACANGDYVAQSDVISVRYADPQYFSNAALEDAGTAMGKVFVRTLVGRSSVIFDFASRANAKMPSNGGIADSPDPANDSGPLNYRYTGNVYFIRNFLPDGSTRKVPSLYVRRMEGDGVSEARQLVEGVEQMKFTYGIDTNGDLLVDRYKEAGTGTDAVAASEWGRVMTVRISLVVRGDEMDSYSDDQTYPMTASYPYTPTADARHYQRRLFVRDVQLRNRVRG
jgi:type IV pilus assembly protein PilW